MKIYPSEEIAAAIVTSMTKEKTLSSTRMTTGDQYFVFAPPIANDARSLSGNFKI